MDEPPRLVFQRDAHAPDAARKTVTGHWRFEDWPLSHAGRETFAFTVPPRDSLWAPLPYQPGAGTAAGEWWGETTGDMSEDDARTITIDLDPGDTTIAILGQPRVTLVVREAPPLAHWVARLESVGPDGRSALITGGAINIAHRRGSTTPKRAEVGAIDTRTIDLHFTTWTLPPDHFLRVALSNAQFPMLFPTPYAMTGMVDLAKSRLQLPVVSRVSTMPAPKLPVPEPRTERPDVECLADTSEGPVVTRDSAGTATVRWLVMSALGKGDLRVATREEYRHEVPAADPAAASWEAFAVHQFTTDRSIVIETRIVVRGAHENLDVTATRDLKVGGALIRHREWMERIPRRWH